MLSLWLGITVLLLLAVIFMAWPLWRYRNTVTKGSNVSDAELNARLAENVRLFREHLTELENSLAAQTIGAEQFAQLKLELERNLLEDEANLRGGDTKVSSLIGIKTMALFCAVVLIFGIWTYHKIGSADDVAVHKLQQEKAQQDYQDMVQNRNPDPMRAHALIVEYKARVKAKPDDAQYWFLLARTQMEVSSYTDAVQSYQKVLASDPKSSMIMAELAQAMFLRDGSKISAPIAELAKNALTLDPKNTMALGLAGIDAFSKNNYREAINYWQRTINLIGVESSGGQAYVVGIERAKQEYIAAGGKLEDLTMKSPYAVQLSVSLGDKAKTRADQIVFIYARAWKGSPMPLAIARVRVSDLPTSVMLDETMAMSPMATLANTPEIEVVARVSTDGTAQTKPGDWQVTQGPISMKAIPEKIELLINEQYRPAQTKP
ncbi:MAG: c-type cytochrome biogenesis protein CcmI [Pseudomonadota bacterium]